MMIPTPEALRVLVVDDDPEDFARLANLLTCAGAGCRDVRWASSSDEARHALRAADPDVVLLDQQLGAGAGLDLLNEVFGGELSVPVVLLTAVADGETDARASSAGVCTLLEKTSLDAPTLERGIRHAIKCARAEAELRRAHAFFRAGFDALPEQVAVLDADGRIVQVNEAWRRRAAADVPRPSPSSPSWVGVDYLAVCDTAGAADPTAAAAARGIRAVLAGERPSFQLEYACHAPGADRWLQLRAVCFRAEERPHAYVSYADVTERVQAERALRASEARYRNLVETAHEGICTVDQVGRIDYANRRVAEMLGYDVSELLGQPVFAFMTPKNAFGARSRFARRQRGMPDVTETAFVTRDGSERWMSESASSLFDEHGVFAGAVYLLTDVTERHAASAEREQLVRSLGCERARLAEIFEQTPAFLATLRGPAHVFELANRAFCALVGGREILGRPACEALPEVRGQAFVELLDLVLATGEPFVGHAMRILLRPAADAPPAERFVDLVLQPLTEVDGTRSGIFVHGVDVTARVEAAQEREALLRELAAERARLDAVMNQMPFGVLMAEAPSGRISMWNDQFARILGRLPRHDATLASYGDAEAYWEDGRRLGNEDWPLARAVAHSQESRGEVVRFPKPDGRDAWLRLSAAPIRDRDDRTVAGVVVAEDITAQRATEAALRASEEQLRQAQKMEAIGQLAGGVAHDFNNLLTVITSYTMMLLTELPAADPVRDDLREIQAATDRATSLTRQLLAFSRRQVLNPRVIDLRRVVCETATMLRRLVGEHIELTIGAGDEEATVLADPGQIEQVVMNLAVNARDAMPSGGRLDIATDVVVIPSTGTERYVYVDGSAERSASVPPGEYVRLLVRDSGCGMDAATRLHAFEPFFTTKGAGYGTGLGLATVYGIVKQSGGYILLDSAPDVGTTFRIYLPRVHDAATPAETGAGAVVFPAVGRLGATVLLAEDEDALRAITERLLRKRGYVVLAASDGEQALALARQHDGPIDLLVTDVVMPRMSGQELADRLIEERGEIPLLFMTGYSMDAVANHGVLRVGAGLLQKPFTPQGLALAVSELLHSCKSTPPGSGRPVSLGGGAR